MSRPSSIIGILEIADASGGEIDTRIRLQKEAYLLASSRQEGFDVTDFEYHHYGPYSRSVSDALRFCVSVGFLVEETHHLDDVHSNVRYSYQLTGNGRDYLRDASILSDNSRNLVRYLSSIPWRALELAATVIFLQEREGVHDRAAALQEAIRLKPATKGYTPQAEAVLGQLHR